MILFTIANPIPVPAKAVIHTPQIRARGKGSGYADLVHDEGKLEGLGIKYKPLLDACNIDFSLVQRAGAS
jgi:hypothetical protein